MIVFHTENWKTTRDKKPISLCFAETQKAGKFAPSKIIISKSKNWGHSQYVHKKSDLSKARCGNRSQTSKHFGGLTGHTTGISNFILCVSGVLKPLAKGKY